jgi:hypothetical protein
MQLSLSHATPRAVTLASIVVLSVGGCFVTSEPASSTRGVEPDFEYYEPCSYDDQCTSGQCWEVTVEYQESSATDSLCSASCSSDSDCPSGGYCIDVNGAGRLCYEPCYDDAGCYQGFACIGDDLGYDAICLPY